jgi:hypothetical protein
VLVKSVKFVIFTLSRVVKRGIFYFLLRENTKVQFLKPSPRVLASDRISKRNSPP